MYLQVENLTKNCRKEGFCMVEGIQANQSYYVKDARLDNMYCNAPVDKRAKKEVEKKFEKEPNADELASKQAAIERYEQYLKMLAYTNPVLYNTPLFIYEAAKQKSEKQA